MLPLRGKLLLIYHLMLVLDRNSTLAMFATQQDTVRRRPCFSQLFLLSQRSSLAKRRSEFAWVPSLASLPQTVDP